MAAHCRGATLACSEGSEAALSRPGVRVVHPSEGRAAALARTGAVGGLREPPSVDSGMILRLPGRRKLPWYVPEPELFEGGELANANAGWPD